MTHNEEDMEAVTLEAVLQADNLAAAWGAVKANRGAAGVDGMGIQQTQSTWRGIGIMSSGSCWRRSEGANTGHRLYRVRGLGRRPLSCDASSAVQRHAEPFRVCHSMGLRRGTPMTSAGFNRRMRKTACPVVWRGHGVQSPVPPSDQGQKSNQDGVFWRAGLHPGHFGRNYARRSSLTEARSARRTLLRLRRARISVSGGAG